MHKNTRRGLLGTLFAGGLLALGATAASATDTTIGSDGILSGTQIIAPINIPINLGAASLGLLGQSTATNTAPAPAPAPAP
ncbi:chaplin family protein, partial [Arthrobacter cavernae]